MSSNWRQSGRSRNSIFSMDRRRENAVWDTGSGDRLWWAVVQTAEFLHGAWAEDRVGRYKRNRKNNVVEEYFGIDTIYFRWMWTGRKLQLGYFEQEVSPDNRNSCIEEIWEEFPSFSQYEVRSALAKCGLTTKHIESQVRVLSGGEQAKVRLCKLLNRDTNFLLLDEPTNHLDVDAKDALKTALQEYRGSILLICHEPEFYQDVVDEIWNMSQWTTKL